MNAPVRGPAAGSLFIVGGGEMAHLAPTFLRLGGGPADCQLVIFPTAMDDETLSHPQLGALISQPWLDAGLVSMRISWKCPGFSMGKSTENPAI